MSVEEEINDCTYLGHGAWWNDYHTQLIRWKREQRVVPDPLKILNYSYDRYMGWLFGIADYDMREFYRRLHTGEIESGWLKGPHAYTICRALVAKRVEEHKMSSQMYIQVVNQLRTWKGEGKEVDWTYPSTSIGDHLAVLLGAPSIAALMHPEYEPRLQLFLGSQGYVLYRTLVAQKIPT